MDLAAGPTAPDLAPAGLIKGARRYDFYQLIELLHRHHDDDLERTAQVRPGCERVRYSASASLGFPKIGRASCRERVEIWVVAVALKIKIRGGRLNLSVVVVTSV